MTEQKKQKEYNGYTINPEKIKPLKLKENFKRAYFKEKDRWATDKEILLFQITEMIANMKPIKNMNNERVQGFISAQALILDRLRSIK